MFSHIDLWIAIGLAGTVLLVLALLRVRSLPVKAVPYVVASLLALVGWQVLRGYRADKLQQQIDELKKQIEEKRQELERLKHAAQISDAQYHDARRRLDEQERAYERSVAELRAENARERERIRRMTDDELIEHLGGGRPVRVSGGGH